MTKPSRYCLGCVLYAAASLALAAAGRGLSGLSPGWALGLSALGGVQWVLFVPGVFFAAPVWKALHRGVDCDTRLSLADWLVFSGLCNLAVHILAHMLVLLIFGSVTALTYWAALFSFGVVGACACLLWGGGVRLAAVRGGSVLLFLLYAIALTVFIAATDPPFVADENNYWGDVHYARFAALNHTKLDLAAAGVSVHYGPQWARVDGVKFGLRGRRGTIRYSNASHWPRFIAPKLIVQNDSNAAVAVRLYVNGQRLPLMKTHPGSARYDSKPQPGADVLIMPRFDHTRDTRNRPPNMTILAPYIDLPRGDTEMAVEVRPVAKAAAVHLVLYDFTNTNAQEFYKRLRRYFFIGDIGDIFETLDFSRNYLNHGAEYSSLYDGPEGGRQGGYCSISDEPPLHHFLCMAALALIGDRISSISFLYLAELHLLLWALVWVAGDGRRLHAAATAPLFGVICAYATLVRFGVESNMPDTLFALLLLVGTKLALDGRWGMYVLFAALGFWTHIPAPGAAVIFGVAYAIASRDGRGSVKWTAAALAAMVGVLVMRFSVTALFADWRHALYTGQGLFMTGGTRHLNLHRFLATGDLHALTKLWPTAKEFTCAVFAVSCFLPFAGLFGKSRSACTLWLFAALYHLGMCTLDEVRSHHIGPPVFAFAAAGAMALESISGKRQRRFALAASLAAAVLGLALCLRWGPDYTGVFSAHPLKLMTHPSSVANVFRAVQVPDW